MEEQAQLKHIRSYKRSFVFLLSKFVTITFFLISLNIKTKHKIQQQTQMCKNRNCKHASIEIRNLQPIRGNHTVHTYTQNSSSTNFMILLSNMVQFIGRKAPKIHLANSIQANFSTYNQLPVFLSQTVLFGWTQVPRNNARCWKKLSEDLR